MAHPFSPKAGMAVGIGAGTAMGAGLMAATDNASFLAVGIGCGVAIGAALSTNCAKKSDNTSDEGSAFKDDDK